MFLLCLVSAEATAAGDQTSLSTVQARRDATLIVEFRDAAGQPFEEYYGVVDEEWTPVVDDAAAGQAITLPAGPYAIEPEFDPFLDEPVDLAPGETRRIVIDVADQVMLRLRGTETRGAVRLELASPEQRAFGLAGHRATFALSRVSAIPKDSDAWQEAVDALDLARKKLSALRRTVAGVHQRLVALRLANSTDATAIDDLYVRLGIARGGFDAAAALVSIAGTSEDAASLVAWAKEDWTPPDRRAPAGNWTETVDALLNWLPDRELALAAYVEARLGAQSQGAVASVAAGDDSGLAAMAGLYLHALGSGAGDAALVRYLEVPEKAELARRASLSLLDSDAPETLAAMRAVAAGLATERKENTSGSRYMPAARQALVYLIGRGSAQDMQRASALMPVFGEALALEAAILSRDPQPLMDYYLESTKAGIQPEVARHLIESLTPKLASVCPAMRRFSPDDGRYLNDYVVSLWAQYAEYVARTGFGADADRRYGRALMEASQSYCRAANRVSEYLHDGNTLGFGNVAWLPHPGSSDGRSVLGGWDEATESQLAYLDPAQAADLLARSGAPFAEVADIMSLALRLTTRNRIMALDPYPFGRQRRALFLSDRQLDGVVTGLVAASHRFADDGLVVDVSVDAAAYGGSTMISGVDPAYHAVQTYGGVSLIKDVRLLRGGTEIALSERDAGARGERRFAAADSPSNAAGLYLYVTLGIGGASQTVGFDLFADTTHPGTTVDAD
jgi:hypothetical protein